MTNQTPLQRTLFVLGGGRRLDGDERELTARRFHLFLSAFLGWLLVMVGVVVPFFAARKVAGEGLGLILIAAALGAVLLVRRGHTRGAAFLFLSVFWCVMAVVALLSGGIHSGGSYMAIFAIVGAAWLIDFRAAAGFGIATVVLTTAEAGFVLAGHPPPVYFPSTPIAFWTLSVGYIGLTLGALASLLETERQQVSAIRESEDRFRSLSDSALEGVMIHEKGILLDCNQPFASMFGYERPDDLIGRDGLELLLTPDSRARIAAYVQQQSRGAVEVTAIRRDGSTFPAETAARAIRYRGRDARVVAMHDMSERREKVMLEGQLRRAQQLESIGRLTGGIAHDFNNLLTVINGYGDVLVEGISPGDSLHPAARGIVAAGQRAADLTRRLLLMSGTHVAEAHPVDVNALLTESRDLHQRLLGEAIVLQMTLTASRRILADDGQLLQVILNLLANARDAMPHGGRLTITTSDVNLHDLPISISASLAAGPHVRIVVADTGTGIQPELQERIFDPYYTTKAPGKGTGLGLSIVDGIVRQNGGVVRVSSSPGHGTVFSLYFPQIRGDRVRHVVAESRTEAPRRSSGNETVLVVEDQPEVRRLMVETLARAGFRVLSASGGAEGYALAVAHEGPLPLLVTDVIMPEVNGPALAQRLAAVRPDLRVLFVSGYTDQLPVRTVVDGKTTFLAKPFKPSALVSAVRTLLDEPAVPVA